MYYLEHCESGSMPTVLFQPIRIAISSATVNVPEQWSFHQTVHFLPYPEIVWVPDFAHIE
jgi:hypothetical protein